MIDPLAELQAQRALHGQRHHFFIQDCDPGCCETARWLSLCDRLAAATEPEADLPEHYRYSSQVPEAIRRVELGIRTIEEGIKKHGTTLPWDYRLPLDGLRWAAGVLSPGQGLLARAAAAERQRDRATAALEEMRPVVEAACTWRDISTGVLTVPRDAVLEADGNLADTVADYQAAAEREGGGAE